MAASLLFLIDDIRYIINILNDNAEKNEVHFLRALEMLETFRKEYLKSVLDTQKMRKELGNLQSNLLSARRLLDKEMQYRRKAEKKCEIFEIAIAAVKNVLQDEHGLSVANRDKLNFLYTLPMKQSICRSQIDCKIGNEFNSTSSFFSLLSLTPSDDDIMDSDGSKLLQKYHTLLPKKTDSRISSREIPTTTEIVKYCSSNQHCIDNTAIHKKNICATKKVLESGTQNRSANNKGNADSNLKNSNEITSYVEPVYASTPLCSPAKDNQSLTITSDTKSYICSINDIRSTRFYEHNFALKTFIRPEDCNHCQKTIHFGSGGLRCRNCPLICHVDCYRLLTVSCAIHSRTSTLIDIMGNIGDYSPATPPLVPHLIVHCVTEIESRGLEEVGLYRQYFSENQIKKLKKLFLNGKHKPQLNNFDIHDICGCIKDFLRSLRDPLIPEYLWINFSNALLLDEKEIVHALYKAIQMLPQPNRDTLAFLILHFQHVAMSRTALFPIDTIARVFAPILIAHSTAEPNQYNVAREIQIQYSILEYLLKLPTEYWSRFLELDHEKENLNNEDIATNSNRKFVSSTQISKHFSPYNSNNMVRNSAIKNFQF